MRISIGLLLLAISVPALAQMPQLFEVSNPNHLHFDAQEAVKSYLEAVSEVETEYHLLDHVTPNFALVLGAEKNCIVWAKEKTSQRTEVRLKRWDARIFRQAVITISINELLRPENIARLELHIERVEQAMVDVQTLRK